MGEVAAYGMSEGPVFSDSVQVDMVDDDGEEMPSLETTWAVK